MKAMNTEVEMHLERALAFPEAWLLTIKDQRSGIVFLEMALTNDDVANLLSARASRPEHTTLIEIDKVGRYQHSLQLVMPVDSERQESQTWIERQAQRCLDRWRAGGAEKVYDGTTGWEFSHVVGAADAPGNRRSAVFYRYSDEFEADDPARLRSAGRHPERHGD